MKPPFNYINIIFHLSKAYFKEPLLSLRYFGLLGLNLHLDDLCDKCANIYHCPNCEEQYKCQYESVEECPEIPCLDCATYKIRRFFDMEVQGTIGSRN